MRIASSRRKRAERIGVGRIFRRFKADLDMALRGEIVDLGRLRFLHDANQVGRIGHVAIVQKEPSIAFVQVSVEVVDSAGVE